MYEFLIEKILEKKITKENWIILFETKDTSFLWDYLLKNNLEKHFNFILTMSICLDLIDYNSEYSKIENEVYRNKKKEEILFLMLKTLEEIFQNNFNEMIKNDLDIIDMKNVWAAINLDSLYFLNLNHLSDQKLVEKKKKPILYEKILKINIIINTLERVKGVHFYTKLKKNKYPKELTENINFTKGYLICFEPWLVELLKKYKYTRKIINKKPKIILYDKKITFLESLKNENFSEPIWLNNRNLSIIDLEKIKIFNKKLINKKAKIDICISNLNFLNSIKINYNKEILEQITGILEENTNIHHTLSSRSSLENIILKINNNKNDDFTEITSNFSSLIQSASILELIKTQLKYYPYFFFNHRLDHRLRIYCFPWPINYQLNHIVRCFIIFENKPDITKIWENFWKNPLITKYIKKEDIFEFEKNKIVKNLIEEFFENNKINSQSNIEDQLKKEYLYQILIKIGPDDIKETEGKINFVFGILNNFISSDINNEWEFWLKKLKKKRKKLPYLINYHNSIENIIKNKFENIFWSDASSNAIQLVALRLKIKNNLLLKLVNIYENDTDYTNIYEYITEEIKKKNHNKIIKKLNNKISSEEINKLQENDNNKYLLMPSTYGMGKHSYREKLNIMLSEDERSEIWGKLNTLEKQKISDYFWECAEEILKDIDFDMNEYKNICKNFWEKKNYDVFIWKNDLGIPIAPISLKNSKRHELINKLNILKLKKKEIIEDVKKEKIENQIKKIKEKLKKDDKEFWKRSMVTTKKNKIFTRIYFKNKYDINKKEIRQSLIPNTIHAYDSSIMHLCIQLCKKIEIEILTIHDSIGSHSLTLPLVKIIFKVANILLIDINNKKKIFPIGKQKKITKDEMDKIFKNIIKSKNFFS